MLDTEATVQMLLCVAGKIIKSKKILTDADKMGDADHGVGMARGFEAVAEKLGAVEDSQTSDILKTTGLILMSSAGGASGAVFGTLFQKGGAAIAGSKVFDGKSFQLFLEAGLTAVKKRGKAEVGDKTMVDALEPAAAAAKSAPNLLESLTAAADAARVGMETTKLFAAKIGKMKSLGDRTIGHPDPGAITLTLILEAMRDFAAELLPKQPGN